MSRKCIHCNKAFEPKSPHHLFCSKAHCNAYNAGKDWSSFLKKLLNNNSKERKQLTVLYLLKLLDKQNGRCAISGVELTKITGKGVVPTNVSIDRIRPGKPYVVGNIRLVCTFVNSFRGNLSDKDFIWWIKRIAENNGAS